MEQLIKVIVRIDDVGRFDANKDWIIRAFCAAGIKVTIAVVPIWLTSRCIEYLLETARQYPNHIEIHQHGYAHRNYGSSDREYEFGANRTFDEQVQDIICGQQIMNAAFGKYFFPAFTPPYNEFDFNTLLALKQAGFSAISSFSDHEPHDLLPEFSPDIDCFQWHPTRERPWEEIVSEWKKPSSNNICGFILHPRLMQSTSLKLFSENFPQLLLHRAETVTFSELVQSYSI